MPTVRIDAIRVENRSRRDLGDLDALASSIEQVGLLHPPVVTPDMRLIAGERRLEAVKVLSWIEMPVNVAENLQEATLLLQAERDENTCRKDLAPSEAVALGKRLEKVFRPAAEERKATTQAKPGEGIVGEAKFAPPEEAKAKTRDQVGAAVGVSGETYRKAKAVVDAAEAEPEKFAVLVKQMDRTGKVDGAFKQVAITKKREAAVEAAATATLPELVTLHHGDFRDVLPTLPDKSVDLIFTDPPYSDDTAPLFEDLAAHASRILKVGGSLITYVGQNTLREVMNYMDPYLRYWWILCAHHKGGAARLIGKYVIVEWKPLLWYVKDLRRTDADYLVDFVEFGREAGGLQELHDWQQQEAPARFAIEKLTQPGDVVLDPFLGSGTTLAAAVKLGRRGIGVEADADRLAVAKTRLAECREVRTDEL